MNAHARSSSCACTQRIHAYSVDGSGISLLLVSYCCLLLDFVGINTDCQHVGTSKQGRSSKSLENESGAAGAWVPPAAATAATGA